jgi:hypothetical protein
MKVKNMGNKGELNGRKKDKAGMEDAYKGGINGIKQWLDETLAGNATLTS